MHIWRARNVRRDLTPNGIDRVACRTNRTECERLRGGVTITGRVHLHDRWVALVLLKYPLQTLYYERSFRCVTEHARPVIKQILSSQRCHGCPHVRLSTASSGCVFILLHIPPLLRRSLFPYHFLIPPPNLLVFFPYTAE